MTETLAQGSDISLTKRAAERLAELAAGEEGELVSERERLRHARELREASEALAASLAGSDDGGNEGLMDVLSLALSRLENAAGADAALDAITERLQKIFYELEETGRSAREYSESVLDDPARLAVIEERLDLIGQLKRKYGSISSKSGEQEPDGESAMANHTGSAPMDHTGCAAANNAAAGDTAILGGSATEIPDDSAASILAFAEKAGRRLELLKRGIEGRPLLESELAAQEAEMAALAAAMSERRSEAATRLEAEAGGHLRDLAFNDCGFEVRLSAAAATKRTGADTAEFFVRLNPGMPETPLSETASGGELSRIMLAIKSAVSSSRDTSTLVFDEIDAGIGGETGAAVGVKLKSLAENSQIICITHLPQIASCADANFRVLKESGEGQTLTSVERLSGDELIDELCRMMGSRPEDPKARAHAASLLKS